MKQKSVKKNYMFNTAYQVLSICVPLITAPYLSRTLGADGIGTYSYCNSIVSYFTMFAILGSSTYGQKKIASVRDYKEDMSRSFWEIVLFRMLTVIVMVVAYALFLSRVEQFRVVFAILILSVVNVLIDITWFYQGVEEFSKIVTRNFMVRVAQVICIFTFIKSPNDLPKYVLFIVGFTLVANIWTWIYIPKYVIRVKNIRLFRNIKDMILLFLPTVATQVYLVLDKSMIGVITDSTYQNGCYEQSEKIIRMALTVVTSVAAVILPRVSYLYNNGEKKTAKEYIYKGYRFVWMLSFPIMFGILGISDVFVPVFFGDGFDLAKVLMPIFSILVVAVSLSYVTGYAFLIPIGKQNIYTLVVFVSAVLNFSMNMILIPRIGAVGASISSACAEVVGAGLQIFYCCWSGELIRKRIFEYSWKYLASGATMLIILLIIQSRMIKTNMLSLAVLVTIGGVFYFIMLLILKDSFFFNNLKLILKKKG